MKLCTKCKVNERAFGAYCRPCKNEVDLKSYHNNKEKRKKYAKQYLESNPDKKEKYRNQTKEWLKENPNYVGKWMVNKYKTDASHKIKSVIQASLHQSLNYKEEETIWYLGCTIPELKHHLESQFTEGMTWDNHSKFGWHIDHIKPVNTFDLTDNTQLKECWHYTNLRPLWWQDNLTRPKNGLDTQ